MKVVDIVGQRMMINNEEDKLLRYIIAHDSPSFHKINDRFKEVANNLYKKNVILISDKGTMKVNFPPKRSDMID